ncbi:MAG: thioredoxin family protein [Candidatus Aenigmarchaeota archaeon]|nr:thioredoxin family protein [Candidatus Aenigmarchaeota archaeon]
MLILFLAGCVSAPHINSSTDDDSNQTQEQVELFTIKKDGSFQPDECKNRGLENKVIMFESKYCSHCATTLPVFQEACRSLGIEPAILDLTIEEDKELTKSYGLDIRYTPTFVFGCDYYVGVKTEENYLRLCELFLE